MYVFMGQHCLINSRLRYPAFQYKESFEMITRRHGLFMDRVILTQQTPDVIDKGVFHNDLIAFGAGLYVLFMKKLL